TTGRRKMLRSFTTSVGSPHLEATSERVAPSVMTLVPQRKPSATAVDATSSPTAIAANARFMGPTIGPSCLTDNEQVGVPARQPADSSSAERAFWPGYGTHGG